MTATTETTLKLPIPQGELIAILQQYGVTKASVFGSYARGDFTDNSDFDLLVEFGQPTSLFRQFDLQFELEAATQRSVDLVTDIHPAFEPYISPDLTPLPL